ncbi:MAG: hypothetical protein KatS3mg108_0824 [Isosphaeraceae bacterium]|jgi:hypothetical protein|nr:MAG: hypothetical protein KatS3mg108_0824 [Isosphaeraceae bacterium]
MSHGLTSGDRLPSGVRLATKNVLLVTCMDLRLLDDAVRFMDEQNLTNRYDQFIAAGASLSLVRPARGEPDPFASTRHGFYDHLELAVALHQIRYIYVIEHLDCGAYRYSGTPSYGEGDPDVDVRAHQAQFDAFRRDLLEYISRKQSEPRRIPDLRSSRRGSPDSTEYEPYRLPMRPPAVTWFRGLIDRIYQDRYHRKPLAADWDKVHVEGYLMNLRGQIDRVLS